ncbi:hypothetical protein M7775_15075, partial [Sporomusa sphaeroides DSM 2875]|nr:hypothetical protein [Sporomusa sphaeroides DSM 2875]
GLMAKLGGGSFASGAAGAAFNQIVINELANIKDPALMQWASAVLGAAAAKVVGGNAQTGASTAVSETKNNYLTHSQKEALSGLLKEAMEKGASLDNLISVLTGFQEEGEKNAETANAAGNPYPEGSTIGDELSGLFQKSFGFDWDSSRSEEYNLSVLVNQLRSGQLVYNQQQAIDYINNLPNDDQHWNSFEDTQKLIQAGAISTLFSLGIFELENGRILFKGPSKAGVEWSFRNIPEGGATITGRKYSEHALERMAPNTPEIRAELRTKADKIAGEKGLVPGSKEYNEFINKYVDPRGITPTVVEDAIRNTKPAPGNTPGTFVHENANVRVIVNSNGDVVTVIPR